LQAKTAGHHELPSIMNHGLDAGRRDARETKVSISKSPARRNSTAQVSRGMGEWNAIGFRWPPARDSHSPKAPILATHVEVKDSRAQA
jgi:hypothetical protein